MVLSAVASPTASSSSAYFQFRFRDLLRASVLHPFCVILVLMFLFQFSGQVRLWPKIC